MIQSVEVRAALCVEDANSRFHPATGQKAGIWRKGEIVGTILPTDPE